MSTKKPEEEIGVVQLVRRNDGSNSSVTLICMSESGKNLGMVISIDMTEPHYRDLLRRHDVPSLRGAVVTFEDDQLDVIELPEEGYRPRQTQASRRRSRISMLPTPGVNRWAWGRCCCVPHPRTKEPTPITVETIESGLVPWWPDGRTPLEIDLIASDDDPDQKAMCIFPDHVCGFCGQPIWIVYPETKPRTAPPVDTPIEMNEMAQGLTVDRKELRRVRWTSKQAAWRTFYEDPHNQRVIRKSGLPVEQATERQKYTHTLAFIKIWDSVQKRAYTVKGAFYVALGSRRNGHWGHLDLRLLRKVRGLERLCIPLSVCSAPEQTNRRSSCPSSERVPQAARQEDASTQAGKERAVEAMLDDEADLVMQMLDEDDDGLGKMDELIADVTEVGDEQKEQPRPEDDPAPSPHLRAAVNQAEFALEKLRSALLGRRKR